MKKRIDLDSLLRSAAAAPQPEAPEAPFGFETRVLALWRAGRGRENETLDMTRFVRRIQVVALAVLALAGVSAYRQFTENNARTAPQSNEYAIADSAIQLELPR